MVQHSHVAFLMISRKYTPYPCPKDTTPLRDDERRSMEAKIEYGDVIIVL